MIPWRHTFRTTLPPDRVLERLQSLTDSRYRSPKKVIWDMFLTKGPCMNDPWPGPRFEGQIDKMSRTFKLQAFLYNNMWRGSRTTFRGRVEPSETGSTISIWVSATNVGLVVLTYVALLMISLLAWMLLSVSRNPSTEHSLLLLVPLYFLIAGSLADVWINRHARKLLIASIEEHHRGRSR
jgi:hypothetical protein